MSGVITSGGKVLMLHGVADATKTVLAKFRVGIGTTTPSASDTGLTTQVPISGTEAVDSCDATTGWTAGANTTRSVNTSTYKEGTGSLNMYVSSSATSGSMDKTTTSVDFTSKDLWQFVYISAALYANLLSTGAALTIRFGSDSSNYYYRTWTKAQLASGWNYLMFNTTTATGTTGSPAIAACDYYYVSYARAAAGTDSAGDFIIDDLKVASAGDYKKAFATGYPIVDDGMGEMTIRSVLSSGEANGFVIAEFGVENSDATPIFYSHDTHTTITKTDLIEFIYEQIDEVV
jgi:hypothetical protein